MTLEFGSPEARAILERDREIARIEALKAKPVYAELKGQIEDAEEEVNRIEYELSDAVHHLNNLKRELQQLERGKS